MAAETTLVPTPIRDDENPRFPTEVIEILARPIDRAALSQAPRGLTSIKSIYISERLNEAFGLGRWSAEDSVVQVTPPVTRKQHNGDEKQEPAMVVVKVEMTLTDYPWFRRSAYGGNNNADLGDAYKGAVSDAISKICATYLGMAAEVYKGQAAPETHGVRPADVVRKSSSNGNGHIASHSEEEEPLFDENGEIVPVIQRKPQAEKPKFPIAKNIGVTGDAAISEGKAKRFWAIALGSGKSKDEIAQYLGSIGLEDIKNCPWKGKTYENAIQWAEAK